MSSNGGDHNLFDSITCASALSHQVPAHLGYISMCRTHLKSLLLARVDVVEDRTSGADLMTGYKGWQLLLVTLGLLYLVL